MCSKVGLIMGGQDHGRTRSWEDKIMGGCHYDDVKNDDVNTDRMNETP